MSPRREGLSGERGFTIVEMVAAISAASVVMLAGFFLLDLSVRQSARALDRAESSQHGRTAMEQLVQELHSSCVAASVTPVQAGSTSTSLQFLSQMGSAAVLTPSLHVVSLSAGQLTDTQYAATGGAAPSWTFSPTASSSRVLAGKVSQAAISGTAQPVFQYYAFSGAAISTTPLPTPLSASDAASVVEVTISLAAGPSDGSTDADRTVNLTDSVVLRYIPASGTATTPNLACQ